MDEELRQRCVARGIEIHTSEMNATGDSIPVVLARHPRHPEPNLPRTAVALTRNGSTLALARDALEAMPDTGEGRLVLERVRNLDALADELAALDVSLSRDRES